MALTLAAVAALSATAGASPGIIACGAPNGTVWILPGAQPSTIQLKSDPAQCLTTAVGPLSDGRKCDPAGHGCVSIGPCASAPKFASIPSGEQGKVFLQQDGTKICLDYFGGLVTQLYNCVDSPNQHWILAANGMIQSGWGEAAFLTIDMGGQCPRPPPSPTEPPNPFCAQYHPIHDKNVYDPSGPLHDKNGIWHTWEDDGGWSHWTSADLIHWTGSFGQTTNFGGDTGSVSPTPSGVYAFWPIMSGVGRGAIGSAKATNDNLTAWDHRGPTIPMPARINTGYRDPVRAFQYNGKWYVGVGCGNKDQGAQFCLFEADDDTLANFTDRGSLYTTNVTFGEVDNNIVWQPNNVSANMMECPDLFPLGDKYVLIGSLYKTNQWWVGTLSGDPPRFQPERVGILDYGNGYAAKTGSEWVQSGSSRRLVFGFTGWSEPTMPAGCGRALIIPRELSVIGSELMISPISETAVLRKSRQYLQNAQGGTVAQGAQVELRLNCTGTATGGKVGVRTLQTSDGTMYTEIGFDFGIEAFYADHSMCCSQPNTIVQRAPLQSSTLGSSFSLAVFVDGGLIEAFLGGRVITPLVAPDATRGAPAERISTVINSASGVECSLSSWELEY